MKTCSKCKVSKDEKEFFFKKSENRFNSYCKPCLYEYQKQRWLDRKRKAIELFGGECCKCGYSKNMAALEFHHLDPTKKDFSFSRGNGKGWKKIVEELKKCILVCSNCHREIHNPQQNEILEDQGLSNSNLNREHNRENHFTPSGSCPTCFEDVYGTKYCSVECAQKGGRKVANRPGKTTLKKLIKTTSWVAIGKKYGVSDNAVRKWAKQYKII
jgi:hypothetical protein